MEARAPPSLDSTVGIHNGGGLCVFDRRSVVSSRARGFVGRCLHMKIETIPLLNGDLNARCSRIDPVSMQRALYD